VIPRVAVTSSSWRPAPHRDPVGSADSAEDLITEENVVVTISHAGYAKSQPLDRYQAQRRGGTGKSATRIKDEDFIEQLFVANTHDTLLCFTSRGRVHWLKVYQLPQASTQLQTHRGTCCAGG
jgi:DNA gyrase/topoisomerase IV subunit A